MPGVQLGLDVFNLDFEVSGLGPGIVVLGFEAFGLGFNVLGLGFEVLWLGLQVSDWGSRFGGWGSKLSPKPLNFTTLFHTPRTQAPNPRTPIQAEPKLLYATAVVAQKLLP